ncbi:hypothetical protein BAE44_0001788, partial [Dichanthelium oligosanthes]
MRKCISKMHCIIFCAVCTLHNHLLYLKVAYCGITKIEIHSVNLKTFVYKGLQLPIDLSQAKELETVNIFLYNITFEYALTVLPSALPNVQNLTMQALLLLKVCSSNALYVRSHGLILNSYLRCNDLCSHYPVSRHPTTTLARGEPRAIAAVAMLARLRAVSAVAHGTETDMRVRRLRYEDPAAADCVIVYSYDLPGPGVAGGLLRLGYGVERVGGALRRIKDARENLGEDESIPLGDKVIVAVDVVVGITNIVVGACDFVVGACDFTQFGQYSLFGLFSEGCSSHRRAGDP